MQTERHIPLLYKRDGLPLSGAGALLDKVGCFGLERREITI